MSLMLLWDGFDGVYSSLKSLFGFKKEHYLGYLNELKQDPERFKEYLEWEEDYINIRKYKGKWKDEDPEWRKECEKRHNM